MTWWEKPSNDKYENEFLVKNLNNKKTISTLSMDDVMKTYTSSQKQALILELYFRTRMTYGLQGHNRADSYSHNRNSNTFFKLLYQGKFWGLCEEGAAMTYDVCQYLGIKATYTGSYDLNHAWCGIWVTDKAGTTYWHGIYAASYGYNLKSSIKQQNKGNLTKAQVNKYLCQPNNQTQIVVSAKRKNTVPRPVVTTAAPSVTTQTPVQTPAPTPKPSPTTTTVIFNTPEPPEPDDIPTPVTTTEPTKAPVVTQEPEKTPEPAKTPTPTTPAPIVTPEPTVEPTPEPTPEPTSAPTETPVPQRIMIPHAEHNYTCPGCNVPYRHKDAKNPYITNGSATSGNITVYKHSTSEGIRYFDADGNEYIDINKNGNIMDELALLQG